MKQAPSLRRPAAEPAPLDRHAGAVTVLMNLMFVRHLIQTYQTFGGDLVAAIVLGEVAHHNLASMTNTAGTPHELSEALQAEGAALPRRFLPTNSFSIAQATGIPRETVRRKVASLVRRGWMEKDAEGNLYVAASAHESFVAFNAERLRDLLDTARAVESLLRDGPPAGAGPRRQAESRTRRGVPAGTAP
jgi:hypothetical protein